jgi:hypothetical protein
MIRYVREDEFSDLFVIHEKGNKLKAYYCTDPVIVRYEKFIKFLFIKRNEGKSRIRSVQIPYKPRY